jgi:alkaline phosphatase D
MAALKFYLVLILCAVTFTLGFCQGIPSNSIDNQPYLVILSLDGFRWDYTEGVETPNFDRLAQMGVKAKSLQSSFPTKTFPNHYSIATGLYPGHHGLVNNTFYDAILGTYKVADRKAVENANFYGGEPIWNTAEKQGIKSACFFWVGSEAPIQGMHPSIWKKYEHHFPWEARIDTVISWLQLPEPNRPHLIMWYLPEPDGVGHQYGPDGKKTKDMIAQLDAYVGRFLNKMEKLPYANEINFIVTTDHGMGKTSAVKYVDLSRYIKQSDCNYILPGNPLVFVQPKEDMQNKVYEELSKVKHIQVTRSGERPAYWHYDQNKRIADLVVVADSAWSVGWGEGPSYGIGGAHGYDPRNKDMHGIFYAIGPAFKKSYIQPTFENVDIYCLISKILHLKPAENDGDLNRVEEMLK